MPKSGFVWYLQAGTLKNAGSGASESRNGTMRYSAGHIQQSRYVNHSKSRNRGAVTLLQHIFSCCEKDCI